METRRWNGRNKRIILLSAKTRKAKGQQHRKISGPLLGDPFPSRLMAFRLCGHWKLAPLIGNGGHLRTKT